MRRWRPPPQWNLKLSLRGPVTVPNGVVTLRRTVRADSAGVTAVIMVPEELTRNDFAAVDPNWTPVTIWSPAPVIRTDVPPEVGPEAGRTPEMTGAR